MAKLHIDIRDDIPPALALELVKRVVQEGRVSNFGKSYCLATEFSTQEGNIWCETLLYRKSDCFLVYKGTDLNR